MTPETAKAREEDTDKAVERDRKPLSLMQRTNSVRKRPMLGRWRGTSDVYRLNLMFHPPLD